MQNHYQSDAISAPTGALFAAKRKSVRITAYLSGKVLFQGAKASEEAAIWEKEITISTQTRANNSPLSLLPPNFSRKNVIGSDEVGTGDYFGPVTVCACYVERSLQSELTNLGVRDSKTMRDPEINAVAKKIIPIIPHNVLICPNSKYNKMISSGMNQGKMKALLHNRAIANVLQKITPIKPEAILIDQFAKPTVYYRYLANELTVVKENVFFATKAESLHLAVAAASIIARYHFINAFNQIEKKLGFFLTKGAGAKVDAEVAHIIRQLGFETLTDVAKLHFANTEKAKRLL